jgi:hypothetical protein
MWSSNIWAIYLNLQIGEMSYVTREVYATVITKVEVECKGKIIASFFISSLF